MIIYLFTLFNEFNKNHNTREIYSILGTIFEMFQQKYEIVPLKFEKIFIILKELEGTKGRFVPEKYFHIFN